MVRVLFTSRAGGLGKGDYQSLNLSPYVGDDEKIVRKNRKLAAQFLTGKDDFVSVVQIHGKNIYTIQGDEQGHLHEVYADAIICKVPEVAIGVLTADCIPLIIAGESGSVAAVHAGWRGLNAGVIEDTVTELSKTEDTSKLKAFIGPAISVCCYQVTGEVESVFRDFYPEAVIKKEGKTFLDLKRIAKCKLQDAGVLSKNIYVSPDCTYCLSDKYFSYRRDGKKTGRQAGLVAIVK